MATASPITLTLYCRVGTSKVLNEIATVTADLVAEPITEGDRPPGVAPEAVASADVDMAAILREMADQIDAARRPSPEAIVQDAIADRDAHRAGRQ